MLTTPTPTSMSPPSLQLLLLPFFFLLFYSSSLVSSEGHLLAHRCPVLCWLFYFGILVALFAIVLYFKIMSISFEHKERGFSAHCPMELLGDRMTGMGSGYREGCLCLSLCLSRVTVLAAKGRTFKLIVC